MHDWRAGGSKMFDAEQRRLVRPKTGKALPGRLLRGRGGVL